MNLLAFVLLSSLALAELPDAPNPHWHEIHAQPQRTTFWTVGRWNRPPLRTNRQTLLSPWFWGPWLAATGATIADIRLNRGTAGAPKEINQDALIPLAVCLPLGYLADRTIWRPLSVGMAGFFILRHTQGAVTGAYP